MRNCINIRNLLEEIDYLREGEELLHEIVLCMDIYELENMLRSNSLDRNIVAKLENHIGFDDSE